MARRRTNLLGLTTLALIALLTVASIWIGVTKPSPGEERALPTPSAVSVEAMGNCPTPVRVVTAKSFAPVLSGLAPALSNGPGCGRLELTVADGRDAARRIGRIGRDVWIPDDIAWTEVAGGEYADPAVRARSAVVATSPLYFVTDRPTAQALTVAGTSWQGLIRLVSDRAAAHPVLRDPATSGDGLIAAAAMTDTVWLSSGMDVSSKVMIGAVPASRTVAGDAPVLPQRPAEVALVAEHALLQQAATPDRVALAPADRTAQLRYTWIPETAKDPQVAKAVARLRDLLRDPASQPHFAAAGLRGPGGAPPAVQDRRLPAISAKPFDIVQPHHLSHVFATWYPEERRSDLLVVVDVSGSMGDPAPGTRTPLIRVVASGVSRLGALLPDDSRMSLWEFGARLAPPRDYRSVLPLKLLGPAQRRALGAATAKLKEHKTGTGLYDTLLASYLAARNSSRPGTPCQLVLFTDGINQDDPGSMSIQQLAAGLRKARDPKRPVQVSVITFGQQKQTGPLIGVLASVGGNVKPLTQAAEVDTAFIHVVAGGLGTRGPH